MKKEEDAERKIYLFSAAYGIMGRSYRYDFSRDVLLAEVVLNQSLMPSVRCARRD